MPIAEIILAFAAPYVVAWVAAFAIQRIRCLPLQPDQDALALNNRGRLGATQRRALLLYMLPELLFSLVALVIAMVWQPAAGPNSAALRWGLAGMALIRLGLSAPLVQDIIGGQIRTLRGPLRKIQFRERRALATEDGPFVVLPVERALFDAYPAGVPATIVFAAQSKRVVAVVARAAEQESVMPAAA